MFLMPSEVMIHIYSYHVGGFVCDLTEKIKLVYQYLVFGKTNWNLNPCHVYEHVLVGSVEDVGDQGSAKL